MSTSPSGEPSQDDDARQSTAEQGSSLLFGSCPLPIFEHKQIVLGHGSGGKLTAELIDKVFLPAFSNPVLNKLDDQAVVRVNGREWLSPQIRSWSRPSSFPAETSVGWQSTERSTILP